MNAFPVQVRTVTHRDHSGPFLSLSVQTRLPRALERPLLESPEASVQDQKEPSNRPGSLVNPEPQAPRAAGRRAAQAEQRHTRVVGGLIGAQGLPATS